MAKTNSSNPFTDATSKMENAHLHKENTAVASVPTASMDTKFGAGKQETSGSNGASKKDYSSKQSWYETADGFGKLALPQNRAVTMKTKDEKENPSCMISSRTNTNAIVEKFEEDKEWVKIGDKNTDDANKSDAAQSNRK